jgi:hypothetical protein
MAAQAGEIRRDANNEFLWFDELDGNQFELSRPLNAEFQAAEFPAAADEVPAAGTSAAESHARR